MARRLSHIISGCVALIGFLSCAGSGFAAKSESKSIKKSVYDVASNAKPSSEIQKGASQAGVHRVYVDESNVPYNEWRNLAFTKPGCTELQRRLLSKPGLSAESRAFWTGELLFRIERYDEAFEQFKHITELDSLSDFGLKEILENDIHAEEYKIALPYLNLLIARGSKDPRLLVLRAQCHIVEGKLEQAISDYIELSKVDTGKSKKADKVKVGDLLISLHRYKEAVAFFTEALNDKSAPNNSYMFSTRARAYEAMNMWQEAAQDLTSAIRLTQNPQHRKEMEEALRTSGYLERAKCYEHLGRKDLADKDRAMHFQLSRSVESDMLGK